MTTNQQRSTTHASVARERASRLLVVDASKIGVIGALAALLGTAQALRWVNLDPHHASEMGPPALFAACAMVFFALVGIAIAPGRVRPTLVRPALVVLALALVLASWGAWLFAQTN